jgi:hypothetical protein
MKFTVSLVENNAEIQQAILTAMLPQCGKILEKAKQYLLSEIPVVISKAIVNQPEYFSLTSGILRLELGIPDAEQKVAELINRWISQPYIRTTGPTIKSGQISSSISVSYIRSDFADVIGLDLSEVRDINTGSIIPWLKWLLLDGSIDLVQGYDVVFGPNPRSRTGGAVMRSSSKNWSIPNNFTGTEQDNWITRAINSVSNDIQSVLQKAIVL